MPAGTITALVMQVNDRERVNVFVDGAFAIGINLATLQRERLYKGQVLSPEDWQRLERAVTDQRAWEAAVRLLEARPRSEHEIRDRLRRKQFDADQIDAVLERARSLGLIDDARFAAQWVANRAMLKPKGARALQSELVSKGVDRHVAQAAVSEALDDEAEVEACWAVARQAMGRYASTTEWPAFQRKLGGMLQRRGFSWQIVAPILKQLWAERGGQDTSED